MSIFNEIRERVSISAVVERFGVKLNRNHKGLCPFHQEKTPSFSVKEDSGIFNCFGCGAKGDAISFVTQLKGIEPLEAAVLLAEMFGIETDAVVKEKRHAESLTELRSYLKACIADVGKTDYFHTRGLTDATIKNFCLGYDVKHRAAVIPYSSKLQYYQRRKVTDKAFYKPKAADVGAEPLYNHDALYNAKGEPVFIVESPFCALSILQCGGYAVALCGTSGTNKLVKAVKDRKPTSPLFICLDNDEPGRAAADNLSAELASLNVQHSVINIADECKDPNELLVADAGRLKANIDAAKEQGIQVNKNTISALVLQNTKLKPPKWIIEDIICESVAILCAPAKTGKSWMVLQMCVAVADGKPFMGFKTNKTDCLYFALEDSQFRLQERLKKMLGDKPAPNNLYFSIHAETVDKGLIAQLQNEIEKNPSIGFIVIDTFQKIRRRNYRNDSAYSKDYDEMSLFKKFTAKNKIAILLVHHLRKKIDDADIFNMVSGSNGIMAAADTALIITKKNRGDTEATLNMTGRDIRNDELVISFDDRTCIWSVIGTAAEEEEKRRRLSYLKEPLMITVKSLVKDNPDGWSGTAADLLLEARKLFGEQMQDTPTSTGQKVARYSVLLEEDGIGHARKGGKADGRIHTFYYID